MITPFNVKLDLFRGAAYLPFACLTLTMLALSRAETEMNVVVADDEYAAATEAKPVWGVDPHIPGAARAMALAA